MFVLFVISIASAQNLTQFNGCVEDLAPTCKEYFLFQGENDYVYFYQKNEQFELWITQNTTHYAVYTLPWADTLRFTWPDKIINNMSMNLILHEGLIEHPLQFDSEIILCNVNGMSTGSLFFLESTESEVYKCPPSEKWTEIIPISGIILLLLLLIGVKYEFIRAIFGPKVSRLVWWCQQVLSRSQETTPRGASDQYTQISKESEPVHLA